MECDSTSSERGTRWLNLGALCRSSTGDENYSNSDYFYECGKGNEFGKVTDEFRYACGAQVEIPSGSGGSAFTIPKAEIMTDYRWEFFSSENCYTFKPTAKSLSTHDTAKALVEEVKQSVDGHQRLLSAVNKNSSSATSKSVLIIPAVVLFVVGSFLV